MPPLTSSELRCSFLEFFRSKQHTIVPSSSLLPDSPNLLFTNAGMNQFVPIFLGKAPAPFTPARATDSQKCIRAGGKHNDLEDVGLDTYHHTFFEMLGNWSFNDYFKKEAITWAWELLVDHWKFPPERLYATVYQPEPGDPASFDQEAHDLWAALFKKAGLDPAVHIVPGNRHDNFWMMGETGPCGPCSELHIDLTPTGDTRGALVNKGSSECIEIWNLVFIQFNANSDGSFVTLPTRHVDTGMGFERVCSIIQGTRGFQEFSNVIISNYDTDLFRPLFDELETMTSCRYRSTLPQQQHGLTATRLLSKLAYADEVQGASGAQDRSVHEVLESTGSWEASGQTAEGSPKRETSGSERVNSSTGATQQFAAEVEFRKKSTEQEKIDIAFRVIADHLRTLSFAIADGIQPGNNERHYVLRRILRRAVRYGRTLGFCTPFLYKLVPRLCSSMGEAFPELLTQQQQIAVTLHREEEAFCKTLEKGLTLFETAAMQEKNISGELAFRLYDEQGFPLDLTELLARERGLKVDHAKFEELMKQQRARARAAQKKEIISVSSLKTTEATTFFGFDYSTTEASLLEVCSINQRTALIFDRSVCYAEMGGQVGDKGYFESQGMRWPIIDTQKQISEANGGAIELHFIENTFNPVPPPGTHGTILLDHGRRLAIERHHTVTHLLHWALHHVISPEITQKGSFVGSDKLTFDFNSTPLTEEQLHAIEQCVNEKILSNAPVTWQEVPYEEVKKRSDIMQFFGDKYGERVRVVQIGGKLGTFDGFSMELCGGTHVRQTGEIGLFRILTEGAVAAGIRRIEAVAGLAAHQSTHQEHTLLRSLAAQLNSPLAELEKKVATTLSKAALVEKENSLLHQKIAQEIAVTLMSQSTLLGTTPSIIAEIPEATAAQLQEIATALKERFQGVVLLIGIGPESLSLMATVSADFKKTLPAGKLIQALVPLINGKGGGTPESARGGGTNKTALPKMIEEAKRLIATEIFA